MNLLRASPIFIRAARVYTAHAIEYAFTVYEGVYPTKEFLSSVYLQPGKIKTSHSVSRQVSQLPTYRIKCLGR